MVMKSNILVAYDFTKSSEIALENALMTSEKLACDVHLVHIVKTTKEIKTAEDKFKKIPNFDKVITHVRVGDVFEDIVNFASEIHSRYTFIGVQKLSLFKKYQGSDIFKILNKEDNTSPFIIVQDKETKPYSKILVPIDGGDMTKQKLSHVSLFAKNFRSEIVILLQEGTPGNKQSIKFIRKFFNDYSLDYKIIIRKDDFDKSIIEVSKEEDCKMIAIVNETGDSFLPLYFSDEQNLILNELGLPVLCVNPIKRLSSYWD